MPKTPSATDLKVLALIVAHPEATNQEITDSYNAERKKLGKAPVGVTSLGGPIAWARTEAGIHVTSRSSAGRVVLVDEEAVEKAAQTYNIPLPKKKEEEPAVLVTAPAPVKEIEVPAPKVVEASVASSLEAAIKILQQEMVRVGISRMTVTLKKEKKK